MRLLSPKIHGVFDYLASIVFAVAPVLFMPDAVQAAAIACYAVAVTLLIVSLFTRYPLGAVRLIPFTIHGAIEFVVAPLLIAFPWIAGFSHLHDARLFFILAGVLLFALWLITDYRAADREVDAVVAPHPEVARSSAR